MDFFFFYFVVEEYFASTQPPDWAKGFNNTQLKDKTIGLQCDCLPNCNEVVEFLFEIDHVLRNNLKRNSLIGL